MNANNPLACYRPWWLPRSWSLLAGVLFAAAVAGAGVSQEKPTSPPSKVTIEDEQPVVVEQVLPLDPVQRIKFQPTGLGVTVSTENNQPLHLSHFPSLSLNGQILQQGAGGRPDYQNRPLPKGKDSKARVGFSSSYIFADGLRLTMTVTLEPTKPAAKAGKRRLDAVLIRYSIENQGKQNHKVGLRIYMDTYVIDNDGCLFAAPTIPGKILDGMVLKDKQLPPYVQLLQRPDLKNPGFVAHLTLDLGSKLEKPERVVLTHHGAGLGGWDMPAMQAMGDSALGVFWEVKEIKPGEKREIAYGYGQGIVSSLESEGRVELALSGSFDPGKLFDITAYVREPITGQSLTLDLPDGMALVEGKQRQSVPDAREGESQSVVFWKARILRPGKFTVRVQSSTGVTQGKIVTVTPGKR